MAREFQVKSLEVVPSHNGNENVVTRIMFRYGDSEYHIDDVCLLKEPEDDEESSGDKVFIPLESITKEKALEWLQNNLRFNVDERLDQYIAEQNNTPFSYNWGPVINPLEELKRSTITE